jgi:hypothetical protein
MFFNKIGIYLSLNFNSGDMIRKTIIFLSVTLTFVSFSQEVDANKKLFLDLHAGGRIFGVHSELSEGLPGLHVDAGLGYMLSPIWGLKGSLGYDQLNASGDLNGKSIDDNSFSFRANLEAVANISADRGIMDRKMNYLFHVGIGLASQFHSAYKDSLTAAGVKLNDPLIKGNDDMLSFMCGFTPQYKLSESIYLEADLSLVFLPVADGVYDKLIDSRKGKSMNVFLNPSVGVSIHL